MVEMVVADVLVVASGDVVVTVVLVVDSGVDVVTVVSGGKVGRLSVKLTGMQGGINCENLGH